MTLSEGLLVALVLFGAVNTTIGVTNFVGKWRQR